MTIRQYISLVLVLVAGCCFAPLSNAAQFTSKEAGFTLTLPDHFPTPQATETKGNFSYKTSSDGALVMIFKIPIKNEGLSDTKTFDEFMGGFTHGRDLKVTQSTDDTLQKASARHVVVSGKDKDGQPVFMKLLLVFRAPMLYTVLVSGRTEDKITSPEADSIVSSFKIQ